MEHIVLEYDESTRTALVVATSGGREPVLSGHASPYIVADGYDFESRSWGAGHYFTDIAEAKIDYERSCRHPYPLAEGKLRDDEFCTIRWCREDIAEALSEYLAYPIPATEKNIDAAIGQLMAHDSFQDRSIEDGWETIGGIIVEDELDLGFSTKQGADFYRDAFGLSNFTEAVVWPSSEGDAAFVMTSAVDSEDGDLAVYKIDADLIGDSKITVDDIERLGGKRELCVYKHGFDGIEVIRAFANRVAVDRFDERFVVNNVYDELPDLAPTLRKVTEHVGNLAALHELSDAELASEIEKAGTAMIERVDAHMSHIHGRGGTEADSAAYYAAQKWHADLQFESARRLFVSTVRRHRKSGRDPQAMANAAVNAAVKAAKGRDGDAAEKRDPCLISAMAQASAAKSATAEGEAGGKKL